MIMSWWQALWRGRVVRFVAFGYAVLGFIPLSTAGPSTPVEGVEIFSRCVACHSLTRNRTGPKLCGVVGRPTASIPGFAYSKALQALESEWTEEKLNWFLESPTRNVRGTRMAYAGVRDVEERLALISFLRDAATDSDLCP